MATAHALLLPSHPRRSPTSTPAADAPANTLQPSQGASLTGDRTESAASTNGSRSQSGKLVRSRASYQSNGGASDARHDSFSQDPLSRHLLQRTRPAPPHPPRPRAHPSDDASREPDEPPKPTAAHRAATEPVNSGHATPIPKDVKRNRVSLLSRIIGTKKRDIQEQPTVADEEEPEDARAEGNAVEAFSQPIGFTPRHPEPPKYIKVRARGKKDKIFDRLFLAQELRGRTGVEVAQAGGRRINPAEKSIRGEAIWAMELSRDGRYLAAGGHDHLVRVWAVIASAEDRQDFDKGDETDSESSQSRLQAPVFKSRTIQEYEGHTETILDLSWSKNNFLLSSSMDKTVRLWHVSRGECLCAFKHGDIVTSIAFHPRDDRFFLAGSLDSKLRLWSIPDKSVATVAQTPDLVTAVALTPDGKTAIAGCLGGLCVFFETESLRQQTQMLVRSAHGKNAKGSKITSIQAISLPPDDPNGDVKLLITSNDARARIYNLRDKSLELKFKGPENPTSQIRAAFSEDGRFVISGSEDRKVYIWPTGSVEKDRDKRPVELFEAHPATVTIALLAPVRTRQLLQQSGDPVYNLCNPPPVQLVERAESQRSLKPESEGPILEGVTTTRSKPEESPAFVSRSAHRAGYIIVTADYQGHLRVFRQDCAYEKRIRNAENWDTASTLSKRMLRHSPSIGTRANRSSAYESLHHPSADRILSWRQSVDRTSMHSATTGSFDAFATPTSHRTFRSSSPRKSMSKASMQHPAASISTTPTSLRAPGAPTTPVVQASSPTRPSADSGAVPDTPSSAVAPPSLLLPDTNPMMIDPHTNASLAYYDRNNYESQAIRRWRTIDIDGNSAASSSRQASLGPGAEARRSSEREDHDHLTTTWTRASAAWERKRHSGGDGSLISPTSMSSATVSEREEELAGGAAADSADEGIRCRKCGTEDFKLRKRGGRNILVCGRCGTETT